MAALDRGFDHTVHHHHDDAYAKESVIGVAIGVAIVAGIVRKSKAKEMIAGIAHSTAVYVLDVFLLREDEDKPMKEYYEYDQGECEKTYVKCGPGAKQPCFMRHKEAVRISLWCRDSTGWFLPVMSQKRHMLSLFSSVNPLPGICGSPSGLGGA